MKKWTVLILSILLEYSFLSCAQKVAEPLFVCKKKLQNPYGVVSHFSHVTRDYPTQKEQIQLMKKAGIGNVRYDFWVPYNKNWHEQDNLQVLDTATWNTYKSGISLLGIIFVGWTGQRAWDKKSYYNEFLDYLISRYKDIVPCWEVMNEVNLTSKPDRISTDSTFKCYMKLLPDTYKKLKSANPKITVTSTGLGEIKDDFLDLMCKYKAFNYFDVLNFHTYDLPENLPGIFHKIKDIMDNYNWNKPVWITECGYSTYVEKSIKVWAHDVKEKEKIQANWIPRMYLIAFAYGVDKVFTYSFRSRENNDYEIEDHFGLLHADLSPKPAYYAYKTLTKMCPNKSTRPKLEKNGKVYIASWKRPDGKNVWALWTSKSNEVTSLNIKGKYKIYNLKGNEIPHEDSEFSITPSVIYIVGAKYLQMVN